MTTHCVASISARLRIGIGLCGLLAVSASPVVAQRGSAPPPTAAVNAQGAEVNPAGAMVAEFQKRVAAYMELHEKAATDLPSPTKDATPADIRRWNPVEREVRPDGRLADIYQRRYRVFRELYERNKDLMRALD